MQCNWKNLYRIFAELGPESDVPEDYEERIRFVLSSPEFSDRDREIMEKRWGQHGTLRGIGAELNITSTRVDQIERAVFKKLHTQKFKDYLRNKTYDTVTLDSDISYLNISKRSKNALTKLSTKPIRTVGDLCEYTEHELLNVKSIGYVNLKNIKSGLREYGFRLKEEHA